MRRIDITGQYKKDLKLARKRNLPEEGVVQVFTLIRTGSHSDLF